MAKRTAKDKRRIVLTTPMADPLDTIAEGERLLDRWRGLLRRSSATPDPGEPRCLAL